MTKSQNTKNEQHCIKQNEKSFIQKDLSLTELWKKSELPYGRYYVELNYNGNSIIMAEYWWDKALMLDDHEYSIEEVKRILAKVPSYEEWKASEKYNKHLEEVIKVYERKDKQATETSIAYNELLYENTKLKELLKEIIADADLSYCDSDIELRINEVLK